MRKETLCRTFAAAILPIAAAVGVGCSSENESSAPVAAMQDYEKTPVTVSRGNEIIKQVVERFGGAVLVSVIGYDKDLRMIIKFDRLDAPPDNNLSFNHDTQYLTPAQANNVGGPIYSLFAATSCSGKYRLSLSTDGKNFTNVPMRDPSTGTLSTTFELPKDTCFRPITIDFGDKPPKPS